MSEHGSAGISKKRKKMVGDKRHVRSSAKNQEARFFYTDESYDRYTTFLNKPVVPLKCWENQILESRPLRSFYALLDHYKLLKFVTHRAPCFPRLVKMFYANLAVENGRLHNTVMSKKILVDVETLSRLFELDGSADCKLSKDFEDFSRDEAVKLFFPDAPPKVVTGKTLTSGLSVEDRLLHYTIVKCILPRQSNSTSISEDDFFIMWAMKNRKELNFPYLILTYMGSVFTGNYSFLPYGMILSEFFKDSRVSLSLENEVDQINNSTWINEKTFHSMQLRLVDGTWVKADGTGGRVPDLGGSSSGADFGQSAFSQEALNLLRNMQIKQDQFFDTSRQMMLANQREIEERISGLEVKVDAGFTELHTRLNTFKSQLNEIQPQITPEE